MSYIYQATLWCDDCGEKIKADIFKACDENNNFSSLEQWEQSQGYDDEYTYDSDVYPKSLFDSGEADSPQHCDGCNIFLENDLTSDGEDYVIQAVSEDLAAGRFDSIACTVWRDYYNWLDFPNYETCFCCGKLAEVDDYGVCKPCWLILA